MDIRILEKALQCTTVASLNRVAGTEYEIGKYFIESAKRDLVENACKKYGVELCSSIEDEIITIVEDFECNDTQSKIRDVLYKYGYNVKPISPDILEEYIDIDDSDEAVVVKENKSAKVISESTEPKDLMNAGPCPVCGNPAVSTWKHKGAPVTCENAHMWFRGTSIIAESPTDSRIEEKVNEEYVKDIIDKILMCPDYSSLYFMEEDFNKLGMTIAQSNNQRVMLCSIDEDNRPKNTKIFEDYMFIGSSAKPDTELTARLAECIVQFIKKAAGAPKSISKDKKNWLQGLATYGEAFGVEQDRVTRQ